MVARRKGEVLASWGGKSVVVLALAVLARIGVVGGGCCVGGGGGGGGRGLEEWPWLWPWLGLL